MSYSDHTSIMYAPQEINDATERRSVRQRLGISPEEFVIAATGRVHRKSGHRFAVWAVSILKIANLPVRIVIHDTGQEARNVAEFADITGFAEQVVLAGPEWSLCEILSAADAAVFLDPNAPPPPKIPPMLAIVADVRHCGQAGIKNSPKVLTVRADRPREIAQAIMKIIEGIQPADVK